MITQTQAVSDNFMPRLPRQIELLLKRARRLAKQGESGIRAALVGDPPTLHLSIESEIHEHPLRALESLAIKAAKLAGHTRKLKKFFVPCLDCGTLIRRSQVILARDQRCRACRAKLQRERRRKNRGKKQSSR
jgi:hypothetical protein